VEVDVSGQGSLGRPRSWFDVEFIGMGRKLAVETMREEGQNILGIPADERKTSNLGAVLSSDGEAGKRPACL
jgi:hypothetical protein